jgi:DNA-binding MarR family transcriptional regulator
MDTFENKFNKLLVDTFRDILKVEELILKRTAPRLSVTEVHLIEAVRKSDSRALSVSEVAECLDITVPSATVAINKMLKKGYITKEKNMEDGRSVIVRLTRDGEKIHRLNRYIRMKLVKEASKDLTDEEKDTLLTGVKHLEEFFKNKMLKYGGFDEFSNNRDR